jgi:hypothetical protein
VGVNVRGDRKTQASGATDGRSHSGFLVSNDQSGRSHLDCMSISRFFLSVSDRRSTFILAPITGHISVSPQSDQAREASSTHSPSEMQDANLRPNITSTKGEPHGTRTFNFLKPPPPSISSEDIEYLAVKGAFSIPAADFRREVLQSYIDFVHPFIPILDLRDIVAMAGHGKSGEVSVLLLQAVLLAGSLYVGMTHLKNAGYLTRRSARKDFHDRARVGCSLFSPFSKNMTDRFDSFFTRPIMSKTNSL